MPDDKHLKTIQDWSSDMLSLETDIEEALDRQRGEVKDNPRASAVVQQFHDMVKQQRDAMKTHLDSLGGKSTSPVKEAGASVLGKAAGVIDRLRAEGVSKALRDDYTAFNLAAMGYSMLYTTATALGNTSTAAIAERHLRGYARAIQELNQIVPDVVVWELQKDGHTTSATAADSTRQVVNRIRKETDQSGAYAIHGTSSESSTQPSPRA